MGIEIDSEAILITFDYDSGEVSFEYVAKAYEVNTQVWVQVDENGLLDYAFKGIDIENLKIKTSCNGQVINPAIERLVLKIFSNSVRKQCHSTDREELIYSILFSFKEAEVLWESKEGYVRVFKYAKALNALDVYVTSGFSNPDKKESDISFNEGNSVGYGYEMILLFTSETDILGKEFVSWTKYILETGNHIYRGNWLEYQEKVIPKTNLSGFLVLEPTIIPETFPFLKGICSWNLLLGVTLTELEIAKKNNVYKVAKIIFDNGYQDYTSIYRESLV